jgi:hypothetical protein
MTSTDQLVSAYGHYQPEATAEYRALMPQHTALLKEANAAALAARNLNAVTEWTDKTQAEHTALNERADRLYAEADQLDRQMRALAQQVMDAADAAGDPVDD